MVWWSSLTQFGDTCLGYIFGRLTTGRRSEYTQTMVMTGAAVAVDYTGKAFLDEDIVFPPVFVELVSIPKPEMPLRIPYQFLAMR